MNRVNDDGNAGASGREASEDAGFAAVGMDDMGPAVAKKVRETDERSIIFPRVQRADQFRDKGENRARNQQFKRAFRTGRWP
jgi:hypothetical protein